MGGINAWASWELDKLGRRSWELELKSWSWKLDKLTGQLDKLELNKLKNVPKKRLAVFQGCSQKNTNFIPQTGI